MQGDQANAQAALYDRILADYDRHYFDRASLAYREEFIYDPLFANLDLSGHRVADLASGSGHNSLMLHRRFPSAETTGFDISPLACETYRRNVGRPAVVTDLTRDSFDDEPFDAAVLIGGLHHCVNDLPKALDNIARMVKPGGWLLLFEPSQRYFLEPMRRFWYRTDSYFDNSSEQALDHDELIEMSRECFRVHSVRYFGGPAYFLVLNSLVLRIPGPVKHTIAPMLFALERTYNRLPGRRAFPVFAAQWIRTGA